MKTFSNFRTAEELNKYINNFSNAVKQVNTIFATAQNLLKKWDGKKLNKRFAEQLQNLFPEEYSTDDNDKYKEIYISYGQQWGDKVVSFVIHRVSYDIAQEIHTGFTFYKQTRHSNGIITDDERIKADDACKDLQKLINNNLERLHRYEDALKHFEDYKNRYQKAVDDFYNAISSINPYFVASEIRTYTLDKTEWEKRMEEELQNIIKQ